MTATDLKLMLLREVQGVCRFDEPRQHLVSGILIKYFFYKEGEEYANNDPPQSRILWALGFLHVLREAGGVPEDAPCQVLGHKLIEESECHDVDVESVGHFNGLSESARFELLEEETPHVHQDLVIDVFPLLLVKEEFETLNEAALRTQVVFEWGLPGWTILTCARGR